MSQFIRYGGGPYLYGESECRNADCATGTFPVLLIAGYQAGRAVWGPYDELRCPSCGAVTRTLRRQRGARPRKTFPASFAASSGQEARHG